MAYKIRTADKLNQPCMWNARAETLIALFAVQLCKVRKVEVNDVVTKLNYDYLRKKPSDNFSNYSPTRLQRAILNDEGY